MAWNKPNEVGGRVAPRPLKRAYTLHGVIAAAVVIIGTAAAWWLLSGDDTPATSTKHKAPGTIREVKPAIVTNKIVSVETEPKTKQPKPRKTYVDDKGVLRYEGGMVVRKPPVRTVQVGDHTPSIFKHVAEMQIEGLLDIEPGEMVVGTIDYGKGFTDSLRESFKDEIVINPDDDEKTRAIKQDVIDVKADLKVRMARGEDVAKLMSDTREDLQRLGMYKMELENEVRQILNNKAEDETITEQDVQDCYGAANLMLEEKGIAKMRMPSKMFVRMLRRSAEQMKKERELNAK